MCVSKLTIIGSDNGLSHGRRQAIVWTNAGILSIGPLETNVSEILIEIYRFSFKKMHLIMSSGKWRPFCLGLGVLIEVNSTQFTWSTIMWIRPTQDHNQNGICAKYRWYLTCWRARLYSGHGGIMTTDLWHNGNGTKWRIFCRWNFHIYFVEWRVLYFESRFT